MPVPSSLEVLDPAYAKTIRIIVRLRRRCSQSRDHSAILKLSPRSNRANNSVCFSFHDSFELWWCEKLAIFFRDRKNYWNYCELFQCRGGNGNRWRIVWQKRTRYVYKRLDSIMHAASFSYLGLYLCEFFFFSLFLLSRDVWATIFILL